MPSLLPLSSSRMSTRRYAQDGKDRRRTPLKRLIGRTSVLNVIGLKARHPTLARGQHPLHNPNST